MIDKGKAVEIAKEYLRRLSQEANIQLFGNDVMDFELGWVFFYQSKKYIDSKDFLDMIGGNSPLIVDKYDGSVTVTGTAYPVEFYIEEYLKNNKK